MGKGKEVSDLYKAGVGLGSLHKAGTRKEMSCHRWKNCLLAWGHSLKSGSLPWALSGNRVTHVTLQLLHCPILRTKKSPSLETGPDW